MGVCLSLSDLKETWKGVREGGEGETGWKEVGGNSGQMFDGVKKEEPRKERVVTEMLKHMPFPC